MFPNADQVLNIKTVKSDDADVFIIALSGVLDAFTIGEKKKDIMALIGTVKNLYLLIDLSKLEYINSESIGMLFEINELLEKKHQQLVLVGCKGNILDVLTVIGLFKVIPQYPDAQAFFADKKAAE